MKYRIIIFFSILLVVILILVFYTKENEVKLNETAIFYTQGNPQITDICNVSICGKLKRTCFSDTFIGTIVFGENDMLNSEGEIIKITFSDDVAFPVVMYENGLMKTSQIHSIIKTNNSKGLVVVLYNEYAINEGIIRASFDKCNAIFICIGDVTWEEAKMLIETKL